MNNPVTFTDVELIAFMEGILSETEPENTPMMYFGFDFIKYVKKYANIKRNQYQQEVRENSNIS